jgi:hypothetical protein
LISLRIRERCTSWRSCTWPGRCSATAPATQTIAPPAAAPSASPPTESSARSGGTTKRLDRIVLPSIPAALWRKTPSTSAPPSATSGVYGDSLPDRSCGASFAPKYAPAAIPASEKTPPTSPRRSPFSAARAITAAAIQSTVVTPPPY